MPSYLTGADPLGLGGSYKTGADPAATARAIKFGNASEDYPIFQTNSQSYVSAKTGQPWHGKVVGGYAIHGKFSSTPSADMPTDGGAKPVDFTVTKTVKQPEIATATANTLANQNANTATTQTNFKDFLNQARELNAQSKTQLAKDQAAFDTSGIEKALPANDAAYQARQNAITGDIAGRNKTYADQTKDILDRLTNENKTYETNAQAVADLAVANANKRNSLFQLASGTPTSMSGAGTNRAIKAYSDINIPLQRELADRRYSQIANIERPYQQQLYGNDLNLLNRESGLASDFANRNDTTTKFLQNLRMQTAGMSRAQAQDYLTKLGLPMEIGDRIIAGDISNLAGIQRLDELANYYTVQTPFDPSRLPSVGSYPVSYPSRSYTPSAVPNLPVSSNPISSGQPLTYSGVNQDGTPRTNSLSPDYSSWRSGPMVVARNAASSIAAANRGASYPVTYNAGVNYDGSYRGDGITGQYNHAPIPPLGDYNNQYQYAT